MTTTCPDRSQPVYCSRRDSIIDQLSHFTRAMHAQHFYHQDLKWRNILARIDGDQTELFWIDCPKGDFTRSTIHQSRRALKDCATLDKLGRLHCTKEERLRFVAGYLDKPIDCARSRHFRPSDLPLPPQALRRQRRAPSTPTPSQSRCCQN